jgi:hypothetical protein
MNEMGTNPAAPGTDGHDLPLPSGWPPPAPAWLPGPTSMAPTPTSMAPTPTYPPRGPASPPTRPIVTTPVFTQVQPAIAPAAHSRVSSLALILAAFVAVGGIAFAVGRWSVDRPMPARPGLGAAFAAGVVPERADPPVTAAAVTEPSTPQGASSSSAPLVDPAIDGGVPDGITPGAAPGMTAGLGPGAFAGLGPGAFAGLQGPLTGIEAGSLTLEVDGQEQSVALGDATTFLRRTEIELADLAVGDLVRVSYGLPGRFAGERPPGEGPPGAIGEPADGAPQLADQGTGVGTGDEIDRGVAGELDAGVVAEVTVIPAASDTEGRPGSTQGTLAAVVEGAIMISLADGQSRLYATDETTSFTRDTAVDVEALQVGYAVVVQLPFAGQGGGSAGETDAAIPAAQVIVLTNGPA